MIRLREYETISIINPDIPDDSIDRVKGRIVSVLDRLEARILRLDNWGKRKLAYEVNKHGKGVYIYALYLGNPGVVEELERNLKMWDDVLRFQTIKIDQDVDPDARPAEISEDELKAVEEAALKPAPEFRAPGFDESDSYDEDEDDEDDDEDDDDDEDEDDDDYDDEDDDEDED